MLNLKVVDEVANEVKNLIINELTNYVDNDLEKSNVQKKNQKSIEKQLSIPIKEKTQETNVLPDDLSSIIENLKTDKNIAKEWWKPYKNSFKSGDIIYSSQFKKFAIFVRPSYKENKVRIRLLKNNDKNSVYTSDWLTDINDIDLVKRNNKINKKYIEEESFFKFK